MAAIASGGSYAGLSAATMLARARRRVLVIDAGSPRNRFASRSHGVLGQDGRPGEAILADAKEQLAAYPTVTLRQGEVIEATGRDGAFTVRTAAGEAATARKLLLATGVADPLPDVPGLAERWGKTVLHCPYCHGYEIGGGPIGVLATTPMSAHQAALLADWGEPILFTDGWLALDDGQRALLDRRRVRVERRAVAALEGSGTKLSGIRLADGGFVEVRALFVATVQRMASPLAERLGCAFDETPVGPILRTDATKQTTVPGVFAAGDAANAPANVMLAAADGVRAGAGLHFALVTGS